MKALFVSGDPKIFEEGSDVRARMRTYATAIGELHIVGRGKGQESHESNLHLYPVSVHKFFSVGALARRAHTVIVAAGIEVVSAQDPFEHGTAALKAIAGTSARLHVQIHTDFLSPWFVRSGNWRSPQVRMPLLNRFRIRMADRVLPQAHAIRVVSARIKESLVARYGNRLAEISIIPLQVPGEVPPKVLLPDRPFTFTLITVSRLEPEKRIDDILAALKLVLVKYPMAGLVVVGEGSQRGHLKRLARKLGLADHVLFVEGWLPANQAWGMMQSAQAYIQASAYEGYGRTLIEAALAKVPIITTDVGVVGEVLKGYEDVLAAPVADPTALSLHIVGLIEDTSVRMQLPVHAEAAARAHLSSLGDMPVRIAEDLRRALT